MHIDLGDIKLLKKYKEKYDQTFENEGTKNYLNITLTILAITIFIGFAIRPSISTILKLRNEINEYTVIDEKLSEKIINLSSAKGLQDDHAEEINLLDKAIPKISDESKVLKILNYLAIKNNLAFKSISNTFTSGISYQQVNMVIELNGTYESVLAFLTDVKEILRIIDIDEIKMSVVEDKTIDNKTVTPTNVKLLDITIKATTFFELDKSTTQPINLENNGIGKSTNSSKDL